LLALRLFLSRGGNLRSPRLGRFAVTARYRFTFLFRPVDNLPAVSVISAGQGVSVSYLSGAVRA